MGCEAKYARRLFGFGVLVSTTMTARLVWRFLMTFSFFTLCQTAAGDLPAVGW